MKVCKNCSQIHEDDSIKFCAKCGTAFDEPAEDAASTVTCAKCGAVVDSDKAFCPVCGTSMKLGSFSSEQSTFTYDGPSQNSGQNTYNQNHSGYSGGAYYPPYEHTQKYDEKDIRENKLYAMLPYLFGLLGVVAAKILAKDSPFADFHIRQGLKFVILNTVVMMVVALLAFTIIVPIVGGIFMVVMGILQIIAFVDVCKGRACEASILRDISFLK